MHFHFCLKIKIFVKGLSTRIIDSLSSRGKRFTQLHSYLPNHRESVRLDQTTKLAFPPKKTRGHLPYYATHIFPVIWGLIMSAMKLMFLRAYVLDMGFSVQYVWFSWATLAHI